MTLKQHCMYPLALVDFTLTLKVVMAMNINLYVLGMFGVDKHLLTSSDGEFYALFRIDKLLLVYV